MNPESRRLRRRAWRFRLTVFETQLPEIRSRLGKNILRLRNRCAAFGRKRIGTTARRGRPGCPSRSREKLNRFREWSQL